MFEQKKKKKKKKKICIVPLECFIWFDIANGKYPELEIY